MINEEASPLYPVIERFAPDAGDNNKSGLVYAANETRFQSLQYSPVVTNLVINWRDPEDLQGLMDRLFPAVVGERLLEFKKADNAAVFITEDDDERPVGGTFKRVEQRGTTALTKTINRGLTTRIDHDEDKSSDRAERKAAWLKMRLLRNEFIRCLALLRAGAHNTPLTWGVDGKPDKNLRAILRLATDKSGMRPNIGLVGELAWDARLDVYEAQDDIAYAGRAAAMTPTELAAKFQLDFIQQVKARYQSTATEKAPVVPAEWFFYTAFQGMSKDDASNFKRFMSLCQNGQAWATYIHAQDKFTDVTVEHYSGPTITSTLGLEMATITNEVEE